MATRKRPGKALLKGATAGIVARKCAERAAALWPNDLHKGGVRAIVDAGASKALREFGQILAEVDNTI